MSYMNIGDPIQENFQGADRDKPVKNKRRVWKRQRRKETEQKKRNRTGKLKPAAKKK